MGKMGFHTRWIQLEMMCIKTVSFLVLINREPKGPIIPTQGIRQGDPLSPYLLLLCIEGLITLLKQVWASKQLSGIKVYRRAPTVSHLLFIDNSIVFYKVNSAENHHIRQLLERYEEALGQKVNKYKTAMIFSRNVDSKKQELMAF